MEIQIGSRFFKQEMKNYSNFAQALFRELIQNSKDAGSSVLSFLIHQDEDSKKAIVCLKDDGHGMTEDVLKNVYFKLGNTTKDCSEGIGGFGKARILTHFAHEKYKITTHDCIVEGSGGSYEIKNGQTFYNGCDMEIHLDAEDRYGYRLDMKQELNKYLSMCQLDCEVLINGEKFKNWLYQRKFARSLEIGNVYVNKSGNMLNTLFVRVNGCLMFTKYTRANAQIVLELDFKNSRNILLSNRDSLNSEFQTELDTFLSELASDTNSALKDKTSRYTKRFGNAVKVFSFSSQKRIKPQTNDKAAAYTPSVQNPPTSQVGRVFGNNNVSNQVVQNNTPNVLTAQSSTPDIFEGINGGESNNESFSGAHVSNFPPVKQEENLIIFVDTDNSDVKKVISSFEPENWVDGGGKKKKLLNLWTVACSEVLKIWGEGNEERLNWITGFNFSEEEALHQIQGDIHCLLFNPVDIYGKMRYSLTSRDSWLDLVTLAIHEISHLKLSIHDEDFACFMTDLTKKTMKKLPQIVNEMKLV